MSRVRPLRFTADIGKNHVPAATDEMVCRALAPTEPGDSIDIAFGDRFEHEHGTDWPAALAELEGALRDARVSAEPLGIFGIGPIPLLMALGSLLGDKRSDVVFDRHRHRDGIESAHLWAWEEDGSELEWEIKVPEGRRAASDVVLILSVSAPVSIDDTTEVVPHSAPVYEIALKDPRVNRVRTHAQLQTFVDHWRSALDHITKTHGAGARVHVFPAVPVSVAVECGRRMLQASPELRIYNKRGEVYSYATTIGPGGVNYEAEAAVRSEADLLVLVALEEEFAQLVALLPKRVAVRSDSGEYDYWCHHAGRHLVLRCVGEMGIAHAQLAADRAIARWKPKATAWLGIAASLKDDLRLADVIVPRQIVAYDATSKVTDGEDGVDVRYRPEGFQVDFPRLKAVQAFPHAHEDRYTKWKKECADDLRAELGAAYTELSQVTRESPAIRTGHLASGNSVVTSRAFIDQLRSLDGALVALEMETAGLSRAAQARPTPIPVLAIRGISDLGDSDKSNFDKIGDGAIRRVAMRNATRLLLALLDEGVV